MKFTLETEKSQNKTGKTETYSVFKNKDEMSPYQRVLPHLDSAALWVNTFHLESWLVDS